MEGGYQIGDDDFTALVKHACGIDGNRSVRRSRFSGRICRFCGLSCGAGCECFVYAETTSALADATVARLRGDDV